MANRNFEAPSWDGVYRMLMGLAVKIMRSNYDPDVIVGVSRGGWPPARVMSDMLGNQNLANMKVEFYKDIGVRKRRPLVTQPVTSEVSRKKVLVVDDVADSGQSLKVVAAHLKRRGARVIRVCTIYMKPQSIFTPDYYAKKTNKWVIFPWERLEALHSIARKIGAQGDSSFAVLRVLKELRGCGMSPGLIRQLLRIDHVRKNRH